MNPIKKGIRTEESAPRVELDIRMLLMFEIKE
jgi:hypothetical protein